MSNSVEKLVKLAIKTIAKKQDLEYDDLKKSAKKVLKSAKEYDESLTGMMEEMLELGNVGAEEELDDFDTESLKVFCRIKEIDPGSEKHIRRNVWKFIESEFELDSEDDESDEEDYESEDDEPEPEPAPVRVKSKSSSKEHSHRSHTPVEQVIGA